MAHLKPRRLFLLVEGMVPRPQPRHRHVVDASGKGHVVSWRHDKLASAWADRVEHAARKLAKAHADRASWDRDARVTIELMFTLPVAMMDAHDEPDWDNLAKLACDALQRGGVIRNDRQILRAMVGKQFSDDASRIGMAMVIDGDGQGALALLDRPGAGLGGGGGGGLDRVAVTL